MENLNKGAAATPQSSGVLQEGTDAGEVQSLPQSYSDRHGGSAPSLHEIQAEIETLSKKFCHNHRVAAGYLQNKKMYIAFLDLLRRIASREPRVDARSPVPPVECATEILILQRTVEELSAESGLSAFQVDKFLRWADKGLHILKCPIPKDKKQRDREIIMDRKAMKDLDYLLDPAKRVGLWDLPVEVAINNFKFKSLSNFAMNHTVGCMFGCLFCYVPSVSTVNLGWRLVRFGILDADAEWGTYCLIRQWDEDHFRKSLRRMLATPASKLAPDGHMAIMISTNTDPYQPVFHPDPLIRMKLHEYQRTMVRRTLEILLEPEFSRFKVRIQTRSLDVEKDFYLIREFGNRALLGMSVPTLNNALAKIYEPKAPAPTRRLEVLQKAIATGIPTYVAMAPTFPECDEADIRETLRAFSRLPFHTIFHESINVRAHNVDRIVEEARRRAMSTNAETVRRRVTRIPHAIAQMKLVEQISTELGINEKLHLWPDAELLDEKIINDQPDPDQFRAWLRGYHGRVSEWPGEGGPRSYDPYAKKDIAG